MFALVRNYGEGTPGWYLCWSKGKFPEGIVGVAVGHLSHLEPAPAVSVQPSTVLCADGTPREFDLADDSRTKCAICFAKDPGPTLDSDDPHEGWTYYSQVCMAVFEAFPFPDWPYVYKSKRIFDYGSPRMYALECWLPLCEACGAIMVHDDDVEGFLAGLG